MTDYPLTAQQGWQCPCCKVIYAPSVQQCKCQTQLVQYNALNTANQNALNQALK